MQKYSLGHVDSDVLLRDLDALVAQDRGTTALLLAHLAEVKERKLFAPAGQPHMHAYCVNVLGFSEDVASKRLQAAGAARRYPVIFEAIADGRLHLTGVCMLAPHLLPENAEELLAGAMNKTKAGIEKLLAEHFPQPDLPESLQVIAAAPATSQPVATAETPSDPGQMEAAATPSDPDQTAPTVQPQNWPKLKPLAPERYGLQVTLDEETHDLLREAQDLLGHTEGGSQISNVLKRALRLFVGHMKQRKLADTERPRRSSRKPKSVRTIPAEVKRAARARDEGRCTFVNAKGERCPARRRLEYHHEKSVGQGGATTVENIRLRCRAHNQLAAEQEFGAEFMQQKRKKAQCATEGRPRVPLQVEAALQEKAYELIPWLRDRATSQAPASSG